MARLSPKVRGPRLAFTAEADQPFSRAQVVPQKDTACGPSASHASTPVTPSCARPAPRSPPRLSPLLELAWLTREQLRRLQFQHHVLRNHHREIGLSALQ